MILMTGATWRQLMILLVLAGSAVVGHSVEGPERFGSSQRVGFAQFMPHSMGGWIRQTDRNPADVPELLQVNEIFQAMYRHPGFGRYAITLEYTADSRRRHELHYPDVCHPIRGDRVVAYPPRSVDLDGRQPFQASLMEWEHPTGRSRALTVYWYVTSDGITTNTARLKFDQAVAGLLRRPEATIMFRVDAFFDQDLNLARKQQLLGGVDDLVRELNSALAAPQNMLIFEKLKKEI
jgi:EpsI family protein